MDNRSTAEFGVEHKVYGGLINFDAGFVPRAVHHSSDGRLSRTLSPADPKRDFCLPTRPTWP